jgi:hypothetical protein
MKNWPSIGAAAAIALAACTTSGAQGLGKAEYQAARKTLESDFRTAKIGCEPMLGNVRTICMADVRGREVVALAELRAAYEPTPEALMEVRILKARAGLALARARCEDVPAPRKAACDLEAEAAHGAALAAPPTAAKK